MFTKNYNNLYSFLAEWQVILCKSNFWGDVFDFKKYRKAEYVQRRVCFVNVWVIKWMHLLQKTLGFWFLASTPLYM